MLLLPFELAGELLFPAAAAAASVDVGAADGVRSLLLANKLGGLSGAVELMAVEAEAEAEEEEQPPVVVLMMLLMLLLSSDSSGFTGLLLFTDFSLSCTDESSDLAIFCKVGQRISQYGNQGERGVWGRYFN